MAAHECRVVVLGAQCVGKTSLISRVCLFFALSQKSNSSTQYLHKVMPQDWQPTLEDQFRSNVRVGDTTVMLEVLDTAGQEEYAMLHEPYVTVADGVIVVFSLIEKSSLERALKICQTTAASPKGPLIVIGNKADLAGGAGCVSDEVRRYIAGRFGSYFETSAATGEGVVEAWEALLTKILALRSPRPAATTTTTSAAPKSPRRQKSAHDLVSKSPDLVPSAAQKPNEEEEADSVPKRSKAPCLPTREVCTLS